MTLQFSSESSPKTENLLALFFCKPVVVFFHGTQEEMPRLLGTDFPNALSL